MQRTKWYSGQIPAAELIERLVLWYEFDFDGKFRHVKLLIKEKNQHTIERYRFCCFNNNSFRYYNIYAHAHTEPGSVQK